MTSESRGKRTQLLRLADALAEGILEDSDSHIQEETSVDEKLASVSEVRAALERAQVIVGKKRLAAAKAALKASVASDPSSASVILLYSYEEKRNLVLRVIKAHAKSGKSGVTLAARNESDLSDGDIDAQIEALVRMGIVTKNGEITGA